jgi:hypothetical protein
LNGGAANIDAIPRDAFARVARIKEAMRKIPLAVCLLLPVAVAAAWFHVFAPTTAWAGPVHATASVLLGAIAIATAIAAIAGAARTQIALAATLLAAQVGIIATTLSGVRLVDYDMFPSRKLAIVVGATLVLAIYGLARRRLWGRWLGLALGAVGAVSGGLNVINYWPVTAHVDEMHVAWSMQMFEATWVLLVMTLGGALVVANLASAAVEGAFAARAKGTTWASGDRVVGAVRAAIIGSFAAVPMLLVYA